VLIAWQLYSRRHEALDATAGREDGTGEATVLHASQATG